MTARKPANPTAAEALGDRIPYTYGGESYLVLPSIEWSYDALEAFESGKLATFLREILGEEQHARFKATKPKVGDVNDFILGLQSALGISGN